MAVVWVLESPRPYRENLPDLLQGDFAVRAFASLRSFLRLSSMSSLQPDAIVIRCEDFFEEVQNLNNILSLQLPDAIRLYVGDGNDLLEVSGACFVATDQWRDLPFILQQILSKSDLRKDGGSQPYLQVGEICLDVEGQRLRILPDGPWVRLAPKELQLLRVFLRHPERCLSHEDLTAEVWRQVKVSSRSVASHISRLRRYLESSQFTIKSVYGGGYQLSQEST